MNNDMATGEQFDNPNEVPMNDDAQGSIRVLSVT